MKKKLIGFAGRKHSGKTMLSNMLKEKYGADVISIANPIKWVCCELLGVSIDELNAMKNDTSFLICQHFTSDPKKWVSVIEYHDVCAPKEAIEEWVHSIIESQTSTVRLMLQTIGTDLIRKHDEDWHVRKMKQAIDESDSEMVVVDDLRFENELQAFRELGGDAYFIMRPDLSIEVSNHSSETGLFWCDFTPERVIVNMFDKDFILSEFDRHLHDGSPKCDNSLIFANNCVDFSDHNISFALLRHPESEKSEYSDYEKDFIKNTVLPSAIKYNGCIVIATDSVDVVNRLKMHMGVFRNSCDYGDSRIRRVYTIWNPYIVENLKAWM